MERKIRYGKFDMDIFCDESLPTGSKALYCALAGFCDRDRTCFPSVSTLMRVTGMCKNTFDKHMKILEQKGIVKKAYAKNGPGNFDRRLVYQLCDLQKREPEKEPSNT